MTDFGVLLPHFGSAATRPAILAAADTVEQSAFGSVWARDHVWYHPHGHEDPDNTFIDSFEALAAVAARTEHVRLGFASIIPSRHPIASASLISSLETLAGPGRVITSWGLGSTQAEFDAIGLAGVDRRDLIREHVQAVRDLLRGQPTSHCGRFYSFENVQIHGAATQIPLWYGGPSKAAVRRAVEYCDGWIPPRMPRRDFARRMSRLRRLAREKNKPVPAAGIVATVVPAGSTAAAHEFINVAGLADEMNRMGYMAPPSGNFESIDDFDGAVVGGTPEQIVDGIGRYIELGAAQVVFDFRLRNTDWLHCVDVVSHDVIPRLTDR